MGDRASEKRLPRPRGAIHEHTFRLGHAKRLEEFGVLNWQFYHFFDFANLLVESADEIVPGE